MEFSDVILPGAAPASLERAAAELRAGGLVGMPTETVYGLAANALDVGAVAKVFEAKGRPSFDPLIVHVPTMDKAGELAEFDAVASRLAEAFWPGPLTLVLPRKKNNQGQAIVPDLVTSGLDSVGLRVPDHAVAQALLETCGLPLAAPSANRFGSISPTKAQHVVDELAGRVGVVLDGGSCGRGLESTVVRVSDGQVEVLRLGVLPVEQVESVAGMEVIVRRPSSSPGRSTGDGAGEKARPSPGMTERHYAPRTPMVLVESMQDLSEVSSGERVGLIGLGAVPADAPGFAAVRNLSEAGDLAEAAAGLFQALRELDAMGLDHIIAIAVPEHGIGRAINDRLKRGSAR